MAARFTASVSICSEMCSESTIKGQRCEFQILLPEATTKQTLREVCVGSFSQAVQAEARSLKSTFGKGMCLPLPVHVPEPWCTHSEHLAPFHKHFELKGATCSSACASFLSVPFQAFVPLLMRCPSLPPDSQLLLCSCS